MNNDVQILFRKLKFVESFVTLQNQISDLVLTEKDLWLINHAISGSYGTPLTV